MLMRDYSGFIILIIFSLFSCGETNYLINKETPSLYEGFLGFRWSTPMSIVDEEFPKQSGSISKSELDHYNTSNFSDVYFLGELSSSCIFYFNETGLSYIQLNFYTQDKPSSFLFNILAEKLSNIYGNPIVFSMNPDFEDPEFIKQLKWEKGRLTLSLISNVEIELSAYSYEPIQSIHGNGM